MEKLQLKEDLIKHLPYSNTKSMYICNKLKKSFVYEGNQSQTIHKIKILLIQKLDSLNNFI